MSSSWLPGEIGEHIYDIDQPYISIHFCPHCERFFDGDFGIMGSCNNCLYRAEQRAIKKKQKAKVRKEA